MAGSLKEQLIELGLAKPEPSRSRRSKRPGKKASRKQGSQEPSLEQAFRLRARQEQEAARAKQEDKRLRDLERRRINGQIESLVKAHALNDPKAELKRNFMYKGRIRSVLVNAAQLAAVNSGDLGVVFLRGGYFLLAPRHVEQARAISPDHVPDLGGAAPGDEENGEHAVPDDLTW